MLCKGFDDALNVSLMTDLVVLDMFGLIVCPVAVPHRLLLLRVQEFIRVGYYVNNEYPEAEEQLREEPPEKPILEKCAPPRHPPIC